MTDRECARCHACTFTCFDSFGSPFNGYFCEEKRDCSQSIFLGANIFGIDKVCWLTLCSYLKPCFLFKRRNIREGGCDRRLLRGRLVNTIRPVARKGKAEWAIGPWPLRAKRLIALVSPN